MDDSSTPTNLLTIEEIRKRLDDYCRGQTHRSESIVGREAAVLIPLFWQDGEWNVLFTRRSEGVNDHKGQVSFPGGAIEVGDKNVYQAALREAYEEIGIQREDVEILGRLKDYQTISDFVISPIVARINWPLEIQTNPEEVDRVFSVPLNFLGDPSHIETRAYTYKDKTRTRVFYFEPYDGELVWGITARITVRLLKVLGYLDNTV